jgi:hypothetical protein
MSSMFFDYVNFSLNFNSHMDRLVLKHGSSFGFGLQTTGIG